MATNIASVLSCPNFSFSNTTLIFVNSFLIYYYHFHPFTPIKLWKKYFFDLELKFDPKLVIASLLLNQLSIIIHYSSQYYESQS